MKKLIASIVMVTASITANANGFGNFLLGATIGYSAAYAVTNKQPIYLNGTQVYNLPPQRVYVQPQTVYVQPQPQVYVQPQTVYVQPQPQVYTQPQAYVQPERTPIYEKRSQYDFDCQCYITINNQIGWQ